MTGQMTDWVWFSRLFPYGSSKPKKLLEHFASPSELRQADPARLKECRVLSEREITTVQKTSLERAELILADCRRLHIDIIPYSSEDYPDCLRSIFAPPVVLYLKGSRKILQNEVTIGVVGTRKASVYGKRLTGNLCYEMTKAGAVIISGCAEGVDTYAHLGALKAGGHTISVLGCGLDINYPSQNKDLKEAILKKGTLLTECPPGERPTRNIFPIRNRLISALSLGILVTEAPVRSGSLITANHALEQGKDLFCVPPHDIYDANFSGVSEYLRDGAIPVFSAKDVLDEYFPLYPHKLNADMKFADPIAKRYRKDLPAGRSKSKKTGGVQAVPEPVEVTVKPKAWDDTLSENHRRMYEATDDTPRYIDEIAQKAGLTSAEAAGVATELELLEYIISYSGKRYARMAYSKSNCPSQSEKSEVT